LSWNHEKALARGVGDFSYNLAIGDPHVVRETLVGHDFDYRLLDFFVFQGEYPQIKTIPTLEAIIRKKNLFSGKYIVPTIGAKHALHAALFALTSTETLKCDIYAPAPYWVSYPTMAKFADREFVTTLTTNNCIQICCNPNNPDGKLHQPKTSGPVIWDAAYQSRIYGAISTRVKCDISVWSGGKLTGMPGLRVGWASTDDKDLFNAMCQYVEQTTSGVSPLMQNLTGQILEATTNDRIKTIRDLFRKNQEAICGALGIPNKPISPGMFFWHKFEDYERLEQALEKAKIAVLRGEACGMTEPGWFRWSLGQNTHITQEAMKQLEIELNDIR